MNRKEFLKLPIEERRKLLKGMADDPEIIQYYRQLFEPKPDPFAVPIEETIARPATNAPKSDVEWEEK